MKYLCIGLIVIICLMGYFLALKEPKTHAKTKIQYQEKIVEKKVIEYKDRIKTNQKIFDRWNTISDTVLMRDTLLVEAKKDIQYLDTSLQKCDSSLNSCLALTSIQKEYIKAVESRKISKFGIYLGAGIGINHKTEIAPTLNVSFGYKIK